jgi:hypothetical protein
MHYPRETLIPIQQTHSDMVKFDGAGDSTFQEVIYVLEVLGEHGAELQKKKPGA